MDYFILAVDGKAREVLMNALRLQHAEECPPDKRDKHIFQCDCVESWLFRQIAGAQPCNHVEYESVRHTTKRKQ